MKPKILEWHGCYEKSLTGFIIPEAFSHPAKYSLSLIERVFDHMIEQGWIWSGGNYKVDAVIRAHCIEELDCKRIPMGDTIPQCQLDTSRKDTHQQTNSQSEPLPYESIVETNRAHGSRSQSRTHGSLDPQLFGPSTEEQSLKDLSCTTGMKTPSMTTLQTSPSSSGLDTPKCTEKPSKSRGKNKSTNSKTFSAPNAQPFSKEESSTETAFATNAESNPGGTQNFVTSKGFVVQNSQPPKIGETIYRVSCEIGDPFGGVGVGGLVAAYRRLNWVGVELEPRFVSLAQQNFDFHRDRLKVLGAPMPRIIQGDSRKFAERVAAVVSSPPYVGAVARPSGIDPSKVRKPGGPNGNTFQQPYGSSPGQIEKLREGDLASVVSSPPYADSVNSQKHGIDWKKCDPKSTGNRKRGGDCQHAKTLNAHLSYGMTEGQIGTLKAVVASPPYAAISAGAGGLNTKPAKKPGQQGGRSSKSASQTANQKYGHTEGQISQLSATRKETYWGAMHTVYAQCFAAIRPGGHIAIVVKNYVKDRKEVDLCGDTLKLLEHVGFTPVERIYAMLKERTITPDLFIKEGVTKVKSRASFFRRLAESKGSPPIDYEQILICRKPA